MGWGKRWVWEGQKQRQGDQLGMVAIQVRSDESLSSDIDTRDGKEESTEVLRN